MRSKVLVLNQDFRVLTITTIERAFLLVFLRKAELIKDVGGEPLQTIDRSFPKPSIIRLSRYIHVPYRGVELSRNNIFKRDGHACVYCGSKRHLTLDHVIPKSKGGPSSWKNLVTACHRCNSRKGDRRPEDVGLELLIKPYKPTFVNFLKNSSSSLDDDWMHYLSA